MGRGRPGNPPHLSGRQRRLRVLAMLALVGGLMATWHGAGGASKRLQGPVQEWGPFTEPGYFSADLPDWPSSKKSTIDTPGGPKTAVTWSTGTRKGVSYTIHCHEHPEGTKLLSPEANTAWGRVDMAQKGHEFKSSRAFQRNGYPAVVSEFDAPNQARLRIEVVVTARRVYQLMILYPAGASSDDDRVIRTFTIDGGQ